MNWLKNIILFLCCILTITSSAMALTEDFNDGTTDIITVVNGSWSSASFYYYTTNDFYDVTTAKVAYIENEGYNYWKFDLTTTCVVGGAGANPITCENLLYFDTTNGYDGYYVGTQTPNKFASPQQYAVSNLAGWSNVDLGTSEQKITYIITDEGANINVTVKNAAGAVLSSQILNNPIDNLGKFYIKTDGSAVGTQFARTELFLDDIEFQLVAPNTVTSLVVPNDEYAVNDLVPVTYSVSNDDYHWYSVYNIILINAATGNQMYEFENIPQSGTYYFQATSGGKIIVELQQQTLLLYDTLASDTVIIGEYQSYIFTKNNVPSGILQNVTYIWGFTPTQNSFKYIKLNWFNPAKNSWEYVYTTSVSGNAVNTQYTTQILYPKIGKYLVELWDLNHPGVAASISIEAYQGGQFPEHNYSLSNISILYLSPTYAAGDWLQYSYMVDGVNYSSNRISVEFYNWNNSGYKGIEWIQSDSGIGKTYLLNDMMSGNIGVCLVATNATEVRTRLSCQNISISYMDSDGYALYTDKEAACIGDTLLVTAISPTNSFLNVTGAKSYSYNFTGIKSFNYKITSADTYFSLDTLGQNKKNLHINAKSCMVKDTDINTAEPDTNLISQNLIRFMSMPIFWGLVILILILIAASKWSTGLILPVMFITVNIEAIMGLFDPYKTFVLVITWLGFAVIFLVVQRRGGA